MSNLILFNLMFLRVFSQDFMLFIMMEEAENFHDKFSILYALGHSGSLPVGPPEIYILWNQ